MCRYLCIFILAVKGCECNFRELDLSHWAKPSLTRRADTREHLTNLDQFRVPRPSG